MDKWREWGWFGGCAWVKCVVSGGWVDGWMDGWKDAVPYAV